MLPEEVAANQAHETRDELPGSSLCCDTFCQTNFSLQGLMKAMRKLAYLDIISAETYSEKGLLLARAFRRRFAKRSPSLSS